MINGSICIPRYTYHLSDKLTLHTWNMDTNRIQVGVGVGSLRVLLCIYADHSLFAEMHNLGERDLGIIQRVWPTEI
jgi:hypothetical protein